jgi:hypothetical protein
MLFLETVIDVRYLGGYTYAEKYMGLEKDKIYMAFVVETRSGYILEILNNPHIGSRENPVTTFSNSASMLKYFEQDFDAIMKEFDFNTIMEEFDV